MAGLTSDRMRDCSRKPRSRFDWVIIDTPPVGLISDANLLAGMVDGVLLVDRRRLDRLRRRSKRAVDAIGRERIIGVVLNRVDGGATTPSELLRQLLPPGRRPSERGRGVMKALLSLTVTRRTLALDRLRDAS